MIIDNERKFDTNKDELIWNKIIRINPFGRIDSESTHVVKYYKTEDDEEYYVFEYVMADNNGTIVNNFNGYHWNKIAEQIKFSDYSYVYAKNITDKNSFTLVTRGSLIYKKIQYHVE